MIPTKTSHAVSPFVLVLIVVVGVLGGYFYYSQVFADESYAVPVPENLQDPAFLRFKDTKFDFSLFSNQLFTSLQPLGEFPVNPGNTGKQDLFSPF